MINAAIVGLGRWGQNMVNSVQGKSERIRVTRGVTRTLGKAADYARAQGIALGTDYEAVLKDPAIDAVLITTPHTQRKELILAAARAGKHVYTEKPFTLTRADADACVKACSEAKVVLAVGFNWRFQPALQEVKRMLDDGRLGKLLHIEGNFNGPSVYRFPKEFWRNARDEGPAGGMTGRGCHVVDAMLYLAGHIDSVYAISKRQVLDYGLDDTTSMLFEFGSGATAYLGTVIASAEGWRLQVFGSKGWVEMGDIPHLTTWTMRHTYLNEPLVTTTFPETSTERAELEAFADSITSGRPLAVPHADAVHGVSVLEAVVKSTASRQRETVAR